MGKRPDPLFLERGSYRQRRVLDAVRLLVFLGLALWSLPLLWPSTEPGDAEALSMSTALLYVFGVWFVLILLASALSSRVRLDGKTSTEDPRLQQDQP